MGLTEDLRGYARTLELDFIGFSSVGSLDEAPEDGRHTAFFKEARSIISIGYRLNYTPLQNLPRSRTSYMLEHDYANKHLSEASQKIARFLEMRGFEAIGFDAGAGFYREAGKTPERLAGDFSHKHAAVACGLGKFGLNNLVLSPRWGPRFRLSTIITSAELRYDQLLEENPCLMEECEECVKICPVHALDGWRERYDPEKGWLIDKKKCYEYMFKTLKGQRCGLCIKACPVGLNSPKTTKNTSKNR